ncbi:SMAD/FHA domain-containing protein [Globomyces pollinis-pini]|nr:SMAD/FHA domain-containing protein [Globomyces pollinis-pini]
MNKNFPTKKLREDSSSRTRRESSRSPSRREQKRNRSHDRIEKYSEERKKERGPKVREERNGQRPVKSDEENSEEEPPKELPNYNTSGALGMDQNVFNGILLKYAEPSETRKSTKKYRLYVFKDDKQLDVLPIHRQSAYLIGRERKVADIPMDHGSISSQHAVLQYRQVIQKDEFGESTKHIKLYIIDLESANGTFVNKKKIPHSRYYELLTGDVLKFGYSTREYVLMDEEAV